MVLFLLSQRVDHQCIHSLDIWNLTLVDGLHVGDIGQFSYPEAQDRHFAMHYHEGDDRRQVANLDGHVRLYDMQREQGHTRIEMVGKQ